MEEFTRKRAIVYLRVSSDGQRENTSRLSQFRRCRKWAADNGYTIVSIVRECASASAGYEQKRPKFTAALNAICHDKADCLVAYNMSRFARNAADALNVARSLTTRGKMLALASDYIDLSTPSGRLSFGVQAVVAEFELDMIHERTAAGRAARKAAGRFLGGGIPWGYNINETKHLIPNDEEQSVIAEIRDLSSAGMSFRGIAAHLNAKGVATRDGAQWTHKQVARRLKGTAIVSSRGPVPKKEKKHIGAPSVLTRNQELIAFVRESYEHTGSYRATAIAAGEKFAIKFDANQVKRMVAKEAV